MPFYKVACVTTDKDYPIGQALTPEEAIMGFNKTDEAALGRCFTTIENCEIVHDFVLVEQERPNGIGLHDVKRIPLYRQTS